MFGEDYMLGVNIRTINEKGRIVIPKDTKVEPNDKLVIVDKDIFLEIWRLDTLKKRITKYEEKRDEAKSIEEFEYYQDLINSITVNIIKLSSIDEQGRIGIGMDYLKKLGNPYNKEIMIEEMGTYIRIWPNDNFKKYKEDVNKKSLKRNKKVSNV